MISRVTGASAAVKVGRTVGKALGAKATGGVIGADNLTWVGENGPEIVRLPFGSAVRSNPDSMQPTPSAAGEQRVVIEIASGGSRTDAFLLEVLRTAIRARGGNVQTVLGV